MLIPFPKTDPYDIYIIIPLEYIHKVIPFLAHWIVEEKGCYNIAKNACSFHFQAESLVDIECLKAKFMTLKESKYCNLYIDWRLNG